MRLFLLGLILSFAACLSACTGGGDSSRGASPTAKSDGVSPQSVTHQRSLPKIVAFGDSLTAGYGLSPAESYPSLLQKKLDADGYEYEVVNAGVSGDTTAGGVRRIDWSLEGDVRIVIVELGANDFLRGQTTAEAKKNLTQIIERSKSHGARVLLAGLSTATMQTGRNYETQIGEVYESLAREQNVTLIPFFLEGVAGIETLNQEDHAHPNAQGTKIVADTVYKYLKPMLRK